MSRSMGNVRQVFNFFAHLIAGGSYGCAKRLKRCQRFSMEMPAKIIQCRERNFVLLEILIAFALVSTAIFPFIHYPFEHMRKEIDLLFEMEVEKVVQDELVATQIALYKKEINIDPLFNQNEQKQIKYQEEVTTELSKGFTRKYLKNVTITREKKKLSNDRVATLLLTIEVKLIPKQKGGSFSAKTELVAQKKGC